MNDTAVNDLNTDLMAENAKLKNEVASLKETLNIFQNQINSLRLRIHAVALVLRD